MEGSGQSTSTNSSEPLTCEEHKKVIAGEEESYEILSFLTPLDSRIWTDRSDEWNFAFRACAWLFAAVYLMLGITAVVMIYKKDCVRMKAKTFLAVYTAIAILGFTRCLFFSLDPYGLVGFIYDHFDRWIIISRLLKIFGFPSLVASYSLMFLTLLKIAKASVNRQWYQYWRYVGPITAVPYLLALSAELIGNTAPYPALISVLVCEGFFTFWGMLICIVYLFAGVRLLRRIRKQERRTVRVSSYHSTYGGGVDPDAVELSRRRARETAVARAELRRRPTQFENQEYARRHSNISKTTRKISIITYATAILGLLYSVFSAANLITISVFIFKNCLGYLGRGNSTVWLATMVATRTSEIPLALIMLYSITDISSAIAVMRNALCCNCCRKGKAESQSTDYSNTRSTRSSSMPSMNKILSTSSLTAEGSRVVHMESREQLIEQETDLEDGQGSEDSPPVVSESEEASVLVTKEPQTDVSLETDLTPTEAQTGEDNTVPSVELSKRKPTVYFIDAQGDSAMCAVTTVQHELSPPASTSLVQVTQDQSTQTTELADKAIQTESFEDTEGGTHSSPSPANSSHGTTLGFRPVPKPHRKHKHKPHIVASSNSTLQRFVRKFTV